MFATQVAAAIDAARTLTRLDHLSRDIWSAFGAGAVPEKETGALAERLHERRQVIRGEIKPVGIPPGRPSIFPPRRLQRPPNSPIAIAITRRRQLAASGPIPPALACRFTVSELAALRIISDEVREHGRCDRTIAEIAARAGVGRTSVQNAVREAAGLGFLTVQERRREGRKNLPNVLRVVSREWQTWIAKRKAGRLTQARREEPRLGSPAVQITGFKNTNPTDIRSKSLPIKETGPRNIALRLERQGRSKPAIGKRPLQAP